MALLQGTGPVVLNPGLVVGKLEPILGGGDQIADGQERSWPRDPDEVPMAMWDNGVFITELLNLHLSPEKLPLKKLPIGEQNMIQANPETILSIVRPPPPLREGTYRGTQLAMTKMYELVETNYKSYMDAANFEPTVPAPLTVQKKREYFAFTCPDLSDPTADNFPPHLNLAANKEWSEHAPGNQKSDLSPAELFNKMRLAQLSQLLPALIPDTLLGKGVSGISKWVTDGIYGPMGRPDEGTTIREVEEYQRKQRAKGDSWYSRNDIFNWANIGDLEDWYTDERFAQQFFTGTNPCTIELASDFWIEHFLSASRPNDQKMHHRIEELSKHERHNLYVQDYSYFREAAGLGPTDEIKREFENVEDGKKVKRLRYGVAAVCLFHLSEETGKLLPLAIVCDWRGSKENSLTIYNHEPPRSTTEQANDWPWRYAKSCVHTSDWLRHEVTVHLTETHLVEEATIVGAQRSFPDSHMVFQLLYPHWQKTLALNAAARSTLVPYVISELVALNKEQQERFTLDAFYKFDFKGRYVPEDLRRRGFPPETLNDARSRNYAWARCIHSMWYKIREYVKNMLSLEYSGPEADQKVADDHHIRDWCEAMQKDPAKTNGGAGLKHFPTIRTFEELVDAVTMCIHIASPQHTSINYLQNYYYAFVVNKPPALFTPPPTDLDVLMGYNEPDLVAALPMNHSKEWLLSSHVTYLLSFKPGDKESLISYALSKYHVYKAKHSEKEKKIAEYAKSFYTALSDSELEFKGYANDTFDASLIKYEVLSPSWNAVSILI